jgi:hypothetical protein
MTTVWESAGFLENARYISKQGRSFPFGLFGLPSSHRKYRSGTTLFCVDPSTTANPPVRQTKAKKRGLAKDERHRDIEGIKHMLTNFSPASNLINWIHFQSGKDSFDARTACRLRAVSDPIGFS